MTLTAKDAKSAKKMDSNPVNARFRADYSSEPPPDARFVLDV
jgi:hypothetical protein